ncbi:MAG: hypothetical protein JO350_01615 [Candidatus Eremiobacteraeota bacterium]|nr:hypothetical protein [Candidatus Eremiobacteraeota bacterium]
MANGSSPIKTVVIIVKENHTYDNYFGTFPGGNGDASLPQAPNPPSFDPSHTHQAWLNRATGAVRMGYREADIPAYFSYARQFTLCDNFFTAVAGPSTPNHLMLVAADSPVINNVPSSTPPFDLKSLPDQLDAAGLTWGSYTSGYPFTLIKNLGRRNMRPQSDFAADAAAGKLPSVSWIYGPSGLDEHPTANVTDGMNWTAGIVNAIGQGPQWSAAAVFITWDDWGGWYDHVDPPQLETWSDGTQFYPGGRVGCLAISPYAKRGFVSHAQHTHVSVVKFCENVFGLSPINARATASDGMEDCFDFTAPPNLTPPQALQFLHPSALP